MRWPSGLRRCVQVAVYSCRRGFEPRPHQHRCLDRVFFPLFPSPFASPLFFVFLRLFRFSFTLTGGTQPQLQTKGTLAERNIGGEEEEGGERAEERKKRKRNDETQRTGFEPVRAEPNRFLVYRLNHSANAASLTPAHPPNAYNPAYTHTNTHGWHAVDPALARW